jgi:prolipoprotein diacylglyceryl transferase
MVALGFLAGTGWALLKAQRHKGTEAQSRGAGPAPISQEHILSIVICLIVAGLVGARVAYVWQFWGDFQNNLGQIINIREGGLVFYGGLFGGLLALVVYCRVNQLNFLKVMDLVAPAFILGYGVGRIGCFLRGCCFGQECNLPWAMHFQGVEGLRHPAQLYASLTAFLIFFILLMISKRQKYDGQILFWAVILHSFYRFFIEFIRENPLYAGLSQAQWIALIMIITAFDIRFVFLKYLGNKKHAS